MFTHNAKIPVTFALAVHAILHNQATDQSWKVIDERVTSLGIDSVLEEIKSIYTDNGGKASELDEELGWWKKELTQVNSVAQPLP